MILGLRLGAHKATFFGQSRKRTLLCLSHALCALEAAYRMQANLCQLETSDLCRLEMDGAFADPALRDPRRRPAGAFFDYTRNEMKLGLDEFRRRKLDMCITHGYDAWT